MSHAAYHGLSFTITDETFTQRKATLNEAVAKGGEITDSRLKDLYTRHAQLLRATAVHLGCPQNHCGTVARALLGRRSEP